MALQSLADDLVGPSSFLRFTLSFYHILGASRQFRALDS